MSCSGLQLPGRWLPVRHAAMWHAQLLGYHADASSESMWLGKKARCACVPGLPVTHNPGLPVTHGTLCPYRQSAQLTCNSLGDLAA